MKTKFLAGFIATLVSLVVVVGIACFLALVLEVDASKNWFTTTAAFLTIGCWLGVYNWLKPKGPVQKDKYGFEIESEIERIDDSAFKTAYLRTSKKGIGAGIFIAIVGLPASIGIFLFADLTDGGVLAGAILLLVVGLLGVFVIVKASQKKARIMDGTDPLMQAIDSNQRDYIVWFHGVITSQEGMAIKGLQAYQINLYGEELKKGVIIVAKNEKAYNEILLFLANKFPNAEVGYSPEIKKHMKEKYGLKGVL